ncbi:MAG: hypothetical protein N2449_10210, partial [Bacteroidales bacterium]|nr:hypothetical protein [Bacteroidales bacterium]
MKKLSILFSVMFLGAFVLTAQEELKNKKGEVILPQAGEYAIGIDATPIFNFFGNFVKINQAAAFADPSSWSFVDGSRAIYAKYFVDNQTAYRAVVRLGIVNTTDKEYVMQDGQSDPLVTVEDKAKYSDKNVVIGAGMEKRRGKTRLQGFYGAEAFLTFGGASEKYVYGNAFSSSNTTPTMTDFDPTNSNVLSPTARILSRKSGTTIG